MTLCDLCKVREADVMVESSVSALSATGERLIENAGTATTATAMCLPCAELAGQFCTELGDDAEDDFVSKERFQG
jgi:hypothetical protein